MNKIYKIVKNNSTGCMTAVSELAKGAKKGKLKLAALIILSSFTGSVIADVGIPQHYQPLTNNDKYAHQDISGNDTLDLGMGDGFSNAAKGEEVNKHTITTGHTISELYKTKYTDFNNAQNEFKTAEDRLAAAENQLQNADPSDSNYGDLLSQFQTAANNFETKEEEFIRAKRNADNITNFEVRDPNNLIGQNTEGTVVTTKEISYKDPVTGKTFKITVTDKLTESSSTTGVSGGGINVDFWEKTPDTDQYKNMEMVEVADGSTVDVKNSTIEDNGKLQAITKNDSDVGVITVGNNSTLNYDTDTSYYTGGEKSVSKPFDDAKTEWSLGSVTEVRKINYAGTVQTILGPRTINSAEDFNAYNKELIEYIQKNEQIRLDCPNVTAMEAFYKSEIEKAYSTSESLGSYEVIYKVKKEDLEKLAREQNLGTEFDNRVTTTDVNDIGLATNQNNSFIAVTGTGNKINIKQDATITNSVDGNVSAGAIIRDTGGNNSYQIDGNLNANGGKAIITKDSEIIVSDTSVITGSIDMTGDHNIFTNTGTITGTVLAENATILNDDNGVIGSITGNGTEIHVTNNLDAKVNGFITAGNDSSVDNTGKIGGSVYVGNDSVINNNSNALIGGNVSGGAGTEIKNKTDAVIKGIVSVDGADAELINDGIVGGAHVSNGATATNNFQVIGSGDVIKVTGDSKLINDGAIYIGYERNQLTEDIDVSAVNKDSYNAIVVSGNNSKFESYDDSEIIVSGSQQDVNVISIINQGQYTDTADSTIHLTGDVNPAELGSDGNNNTAVYVNDANVTVNAKIILDDIGSTGLWVDKGDVTLNGTIEVNSKNLSNGDVVRSFGAWIEGVNSKLTMADNSSIKMNADGAIGVHIRDGASAEIIEHASIDFGDHKNQIGFLVSGIREASSINYTSTEPLKLKGEGSVIFRIERGSEFNSTTVSSELYSLDSNHTKNSTLMLFTNGPTATNTSNQTEANLAGFTLTVDGENAKGVSVQGGANVTIDTSTTINLTGDGAILASIDGYYYDIDGKHVKKHDGKSFLESHAVLKSSDNVTGENSVGYHILNSGKLDHFGTINFLEPSKNNIGVKIESGGTLINEDNAHIKVHGTAIEISGSTSQALVQNNSDSSGAVVWAVGANGNNNDSAYHVLDQASLKLTGKGVNKAEGTAHGILVDGASKIVLDGAMLDLHDDGGSNFSSGNGIENRSSLTKIQLTKDATINVRDGYGIHSSVGFSQDAQTSGIINVYGSGTGIRFEAFDSHDGLNPGTTNNSITNSNYEKVVVNVYDQNGHGIYVDSSQSVKTSASVNIISSTGQSALEIKGTTATASQSGYLYSANTNSTIVDLNNGYLKDFTNNGELLFGSFAGDNSSGWSALSKTDAENSNAYAIKTQNSEKNMTFTNDSLGKINGIVELLGHDGTTGNKVILKGEGNVFKTGQGDDEFIVHQVIGDDLGGANQVKQFVKLDGGDGFDSITFDNNSKFDIHNDDTLKNIEYIKLDNNSKVTLNELSTSKGLNTGVQTYDIKDADSNLIYIWNQTNNAFDRELAGKGTFTVDLQNQNADNWFAFDVAAKVKDAAGNLHLANKGDFEGTLELKNASYLLDDTTTNNNTEALKNATLKVSDNSYVKVGDDEQKIGGLTFNGGSVDFGTTDYVLNGTGNTSAPNLSDHHITVSGDLNLHSGKVQITTHIENYNPNIPTTQNLLDHGVLDSFVKIVSVKGDIHGSAASVDLVDHNGDDICGAGVSSSKQYSDLTQGSDIVAKATYDVRLVKYSNERGEDNNPIVDGDGRTVQGDGLYVGYGLKKVELINKNDAGNALIINADTSNLSNELDAYITSYQDDGGNLSHGDIQIQGLFYAVTFSNTNNDYLGATHVTQDASLVAGDNGVLGNTYKLHLDDGGSFDLAGYNQTVGSVVAHTDGSTINLNGGKFTISGKDHTNGGTDHNGDAVDSDALVSHIGSDTLIGSGSLIFGDASLTRAVIATPVTNIYGDNLNLSAAVTNAMNSTINTNSYGALGTGSFANNGTLNLILSDDGVLSNSGLTGYGTVNKSGSGTLTFTDAEKAFAGTVNVNSGAMIFDGENNANSYNATDVNVNGIAYAINNTTFAGNVKNSGAFFVGELANVDASNFTQASVTIDQDYTGEAGSALYFNGILKGDTDSEMNVLNINGSSSGESTVYVNKIGGMGAKTINGIELINVADVSDAEFIQGNRIIAGAYDYKLQRSESNSNNWVLMSNLTARPETGIYVGNVQTANNMFNLRLHDRLGETQYTDYLTGEQKVTSMWLRHQFGYNKYKAANGDLSNKDSWNITQLGGDIAQWSSNELNRLHVGLMAGHGRATTKSHSTIDGAKADGTLEGYSYGAYVTWYDNEEDKTGLYVDTWALWNNFNASVKGEQFSEKYRIKGLTASVESGYSFLTGETENYDVWLQPKGQITWGNVKAKDRVEENGTHVSNNHGNIQTRLGLRASLLSKSEMVSKTNTTGQMFLEANWLHNSKLFDVTLNDELTIKQDGARNIAELKVGVEGNISKNHDVWFNLAGQRGDHSYENASIMLGYKYSF